MSVNSVNWGPKGGINTKSYVLAMAYEDATKYPQLLPGHALGGVSQNLIDALLVARVYYENGQNVTRFEVSRAAEETHREYTLGYPEGVMSTPAMDLARYKQGSARDFFAIYTCGEAQYEHFLVFTNGRLNPPVETGEITQISEQTSVGEQSTMFIERRLMKFRLFGSMIYSDATSTNVIGAVTIQEPTCSTSDGGLFDVGTVFVGDGTGAVAAVAKGTTDRFGSFSSDVNVGASLWHVADAVEIGDIIVAGLADDLDPDTGIAGGIQVSIDGGATFFAPLSTTAPAVPIYGVASFDNAYYAVGGGGEIWKSEDGVNWVQVPHNITTETLTGIAVDEENQRAYVSATNSVALAIEGTTVIDLSPSLAASGLAAATTLFSVAVYDADFVAFGGAAGVYYESQDGGVTWNAVSLAASTDDVKVLLGSRYRQVAGAGASIIVRDILTKMNFSRVVLRYGQTVAGNIVSGEMGFGPHGDNIFLLGDDTGDLYILKPAIDVF